MGRLTELIRGAREEGGSVSGSIGLGIKERLKEKLDPRSFINQDGMMAALFPSLRKYKSKIGKRDTSPTLNAGSIKSLQVSDKNTEIAAKNSMVLGTMHRDFNVMRQNFAKLVKLKGGNPTNKADMYFMSAKTREAAYNTQANPKAPESVGPDKKTSAFDIFTLMAVVAGLGFAIKKGIEYLSDKIKESFLQGLSDLPSTMLEGVKSLFTINKENDTSIVDIGNKTLDWFKNGGMENLFTQETMDKLQSGVKSAAEGTLTVLSGSTSAEAAMMPSDWGGGGEWSSGGGTGTGLGAGPRPTSPGQIPSNVPFYESGNTPAPLNEDRKKYQKMVYDAFANAGFSPKQSLALTAEVGRENGYNPNFMFGSAPEPHKGEAYGRPNFGILSWGDPTRRDKLLAYMRQQGMTYQTKDKQGRPVELFKQSQDSLNAMAKFAMKEMMEDPMFERTRKEFLPNKDIGRDTAAEVLGKDFIRWRYTDPAYRSHHTFRNQFYSAIEQQTQPKEQPSQAQAPKEPPKEPPKKVSAVQEKPQTVAVGDAIDKDSTLFNQMVAAFKKQDIIINNVNVAPSPAPVNQTVAKAPNKAGKDSFEILFDLNATQA